MEGPAPVAVGRATANFHSTAVRSEEGSDPALIGDLTMAARESVHLHGEIPGYDHGDDRHDHMPQQAHGHPGRHIKRFS
jgi:hypothetical protein